MFTLNHTWQKARQGVLHTAHGDIPTPCFMPIATKGAVQYVSNRDFESINNDILLSNTYHLYLRPGLDTLRASGGLHTLMNWSKPILTDSGGFQVFSLAQLRKLTEHGVVFQSHIDGRTIEFTPELSMEIQSVIGSDIWMCFDYFPGYPATHTVTEYSVNLTTRWAKRCLDWYQTNSNADHKLFGIVQGSVYDDLRVMSAQQLTALDFSGYAVGGLAVGEPVEEMYHALDVTVPHLPTNKPRYLMGVGQPEQILQAVLRGVDMFDCVLPTRNARHGQVYVHTATDLVDAALSTVAYEKMTIKAERYKTDNQPLDVYCNCSTCTSGYSRAYIRHLYTVNDPLAKQLCTVHNVSFYIELLRTLRERIMVYSLQ